MQGTFEAGCGVLSDCESRGIAASSWIMCKTHSSTVAHAVDSGSTKSMCSAPAISTSRRFSWSAARRSRKHRLSETGTVSSTRSVHHDSRRLQCMARRASLLINSGRLLLTASEKFRDRVIA